MVRLRFENCCVTKLGLIELALLMQMHGMLQLLRRVCVLILR
jgi:hypothetical protein